MIRSRDARTPLTSEPDPLDRNGCGCLSRSLRPSPPVRPRPRALRASWIPRTPNFASSRRGSGAVLPKPCPSSALARAWRILRPRWTRPSQRARARRRSRRHLQTARPGTPPTAPKEGRKHRSISGRRGARCGAGGHGGAAGCGLYPAMFLMFLKLMGEFFPLPFDHLAGLGGAACSRVTFLWCFLVSPFLTPWCYLCRLVSHPFLSLNLSCSAGVGVQEPPRSAGPAPQAPSTAELHSHSPQSRNLKT